MIASSILLPMVSLALLPVVAIAIKIRISRVVRKLGPVRLCFSNKIRYHFFGVLVTAPLLIILLLFRKFDLLTTIAICGTGLIGFYIATHDILCSSKCGIYEKGIIWNGTWIFFDLIRSWERTDSFTISVVLKDLFIKKISFSEEEILNTLQSFLPSS